MSVTKVFPGSAVRYEPIRTHGRGVQRACEHVSPEDGIPFCAGIAELSHIRIADYEFSVDDYLYVLEGAITISDDDKTVTLGPGDAIFIPAGTKVTMEVPERMLWAYASTRPDPRPWSEWLKEAGGVTEL